MRSSDVPHTGNEELRVTCVLHWGMLRIPCAMIILVAVNVAVNVSVIIMDTQLYLKMRIITGIVNVRLPYCSPGGSGARHVTELLPHPSRLACQ